MIHAKIFETKTQNTTGISQPVIRKSEGSKVNLSEFYFGAPCCTLEELEQYAAGLGKLNHERKLAAGVKRSLHDELSTELGFYSWGRPAEFIFMLCDYWLLQDEAKYLAIEIFNVFMSALLSQLQKLIFNKLKEGFTSTDGDSFSTSCSSSGVGCSHLQYNAGNVLDSADRDTHMDYVARRKTGKQKVKKEWSRTLHHIKSQMELRAITCVVIASKVTAHYEIVTLNKALDFLRAQGHHFSKSVLVKSELRILNAINYQIRSLPSPHPYMVVMLEILTRSDSSLSAHHFYPICIRLLDLFYFYRPFIIGSFVKTGVDKSGLPSFENADIVSRYLVNMNDLMLISAGIIASAVYVKNKSISDRVITLLCKMIGVEECDVTRFSCILLNKALACVDTK